MSSTIKEFWQADEEGVKLMTLKEERRLTFDEFVLRLQSTKVSTPILPHGTIWYEHNNTDKLFALQLPPRKRTIPYYGKYYEIGCPSFVMLVKTSGTFVANVALAAAKKPVNDFDDQLIRVPLPNMDDRGALCLGCDFGSDGTKFKTEIERIRNTIAHIEASKYNNHLLPLTEWVPADIRGTYSYKMQYGDNRETSAQHEYHNVLTRWAEMTKNDDWLQVLDVIEWAPFGSFTNFIRGGI